MSSLYQAHACGHVPRETHACSPVFMTDPINMATTRHMHSISIFMKIQRLWQVVVVSIVCGQILDVIFIPLHTCKNGMTRIVQSINSYRKLHKYLHRAS
jgi:hypothetical protein